MSGMREGAAVTMTGGEALARQLRAEGIGMIFGVPGVQLDHAVDGIARQGAGLQFWNTRHEQAASYMADGFARGGGGVGVCMVVPGPGLLNASAGIATAYACSSRVLVLAGQLPSGAIGQGYGLLHEIPEQSRLLASLTKWSSVARSAREVPSLVAEAMRQLRSGRPRPVGVELPPDVLAESAPVELAAPPAGDAGRLAPDDGQVSAAAEILRTAQRPVIVAGGGVLASAASAELASLAEALGAPVAMTRNGRGAISDRHELAVGPLGLSRVLRDADAVLVAGSRFVSPAGRVMPVPAGARVVLVNAEPGDLGAPRRADVAVLGDAGLCLGELAALVGPPAAPGRGAAAAAAVRQACEQDLKALEPQMSYVAALRRALPEDGLLVNELTQVGYVAGLGFPVWSPGTFLTPGYQGTLGYGFPTALGAKTARPERAVVSITGDGGFGWALQELATARQRRIGVAVVVFNDSAFGNVRRTQKEDFAGRFAGTELRNPDFVALAEAFGVQGCRADSPGRLEGALREALSGPEPVLVEVPLGECPSPWPLMGAATAPPAE